MQAALKTIGEEDKYFSKVSLRLGSIFIIVPSTCASLIMCPKMPFFPSRMPSFGITVKSSLLDLPKATSSVDGSSTASSEMSLDGWDGIALEYSVDWPLHLFFTQEVLSK